MEQFVNFGAYSLALPCGAGDTTLSLSSVAGLPATGTFSLAIGPVGQPATEVVTVTAVTAGTPPTLTVVRGEIGTAVAHATGSQLVPLQTARTAQQLKTDLSPPISLQQAGTVPSPTPVHLFSVQPTDPVKAPYSLYIGGAVFNGQWDTVFYLGYNADATVAGEPICRLNMEQNFETVPGTFYLECYFETGVTPSSTIVRPMGFVLNRVGGQVDDTICYANGSGTGHLYLFGGTGANTAQNQQWQVVDGQFLFTQASYTLLGSGNLTIASTTTLGTGNLLIQGAAQTQLASIAGPIFIQSGSNQPIAITSGQYIQLTCAAGQVCALTADSGSFRTAANASQATWDTTVSNFRLYPVTTNTGSIGTSGNAWASVWSTYFDVGTTGVHTPPSSGISLNAGGTITLNASQYAPGYLTLTGTLPNNTTVILPATMGAEWTIDATGVTASGHTLTLQANGVNWGTTIAMGSSASLYKVKYGGAGKLYGITLAP